MSNEILECTLCLLNDWDSFWFGSATVAHKVLLRFFHAFPEACCVRADYHGSASALTSKLSKVTFNLTHNTSMLVECLVGEVAGPAMMPMMLMGSDAKTSMQDGLWELQVQVN